MDLVLKKTKKKRKMKRKNQKKKTVCVEKDEKIDEKNNENSCEIPLKIGENIVETRRTSFFNKNKGQGSPKKMKYTR